MQITGIARAVVDRASFVCEIPGLGSAAFASVGELSVEAAVVT